MRKAHTRIASGFAAVLGALVVIVLLGPRLLHVSPPLARHSAQSLPAGVCPLAVDKLPVSDATRLEAKLVTFDSARVRDPDFPWRQDPSASGAREILPNPAPLFLWVVVGEGNFHLTFPRPPQSSKDVGSFNELILYIRADSCDGIALKSGGSGWPAWFDNISATAAIKIK